MTAPDLKCECGTVLADGGPVGLYCPNRDCRIEADLVAKVFKAMRERNTRAVDPAAIREAALREAVEAIKEHPASRCCDKDVSIWFQNTILALTQKETTK